MHQTSRQLLVIADDFGIGPNTTAGILQVASKGMLSGAAFLVNAPSSVDAIRHWRKAGSTLELGWHPNLTLDYPIADRAQVPSLVRADGTFWPLSQFLKRWLFGRLNANEIHRELTLQLQRFIELVGHPPRFVNFHQHIALFAPVGGILLQVLAQLPERPYVRRVREPWPILAKMSGARFKRVLLNYLGRRASRLQAAHGFPGNDWLAGLTNPRRVEDPLFFATWLKTMPGRIVELMCHPGQHDPTLIGRDCTETDGLVQQRVNELRLLQEPAFREAIQLAGFQLTTPTELLFGHSGHARCA
jgi:predicted glycoside hydrolase/deacetylase ChbG (UPF0249 family)